MDDYTHSDNYSTHEKINRAIQLEEESEFWQEKVLELKLKKVKDDMEYERQKSELEIKVENETKLNSDLKNEFEMVKEVKKKYDQENSEAQEKLNSLRDQIANFEEVNSEMYSEFIEKTNHITKFDNPENLMIHLMGFDKETLKSLVIRLNIMQNEKFMHFMMQQQYYNQMYVQNKGMVPPQFYPGYNDTQGTPEEDTNEHTN